MAPEIESDSKLEIGHVLTMDVVGYSTLLITEQTRVIADLTAIVKNTKRFRNAEATGKLVCIPTGDGMALVFFDDPLAPIECAMEVAVALKSHPEIRLRMGVHSGPVNSLLDVTGRSNVAGAGIDMAQLGDAYAVRGRRDEALKILEQLQVESGRRYVPAYSFAIIDLGLGDKNEALRWLEKDFKDRDGWGVGFIRVDPILDPLRGDPRFQQLAERIIPSGLH